MLLLSDKDSILDKILRSYEIYYDVEKFQDQSLPLVAKCEFHVHNEKFVLSQKAQLWSTDANEYVYIFKINNLNEELFLKCKDSAYEYGMKLIKFFIVIYVKIITITLGNLFKHTPYLIF